MLFHSHEGYKERAESDKGRPRRSVISQQERTQNTRARAERGVRLEIAERLERSERAERPSRPLPRRPPRARSPSAPHTDQPSDRSPDDMSHIIGDKRKTRSFSLERSDDEVIHAPSVKLPEFKGGGDTGASSSDSSESGGSLLCSLAPKWLSQGRARRNARRRDQERAAPAPAPPAPPAPDADLFDQQPPGNGQAQLSFAKYNP